MANQANENYNKKKEKTVSLGRTNEGTNRIKWRNKMKRKRPNTNRRRTKKRTQIDETRRKKQMKIKRNVHKSIDFPGILLWQNSFVCILTHICKAVRLTLLFIVDFDSGKFDSCNFCFFFVFSFCVLLLFFVSVVQLELKYCSMK